MIIVATDWSSYLGLLRDNYLMRIMAARFWVSYFDYIYVFTAIFKAFFLNNHQCIYTKTIIRLRLSDGSDYGEYSPWLRLCEYSPITTSPSAKNC